MAVENWVVLEPGVPVRLHFKDHRVVDRQITDPTFKTARTVKGLMFLVDQVDGRPVDLTFSVLSQKLYSDFMGDLPGKAYTRYVYTVVKDAPGTVPPRIVERRPR